CDYWALDLDNIEVACTRQADCGSSFTCNTTLHVCEPSAAGQQFLVSISNPNAEEAVATVTHGETGVQTQYTVPPESALPVPLDRLDVGGTGISRHGYRIQTELPVSVHQFNPANNAGVYSNDASLLLPTNAAGREYIVLGWPTGPFGVSGDTFRAHSHATVVAVGDSEATISVTPSVDLQPIGSGSGITEGNTGSVTLQPGEILDIQTVNNDHTESNRDYDLTGTIIQSTEPILVFFSHECAFVPDDPVVGYCDHLEQQLYPVEAWGTRYLIGKTRPRGTEPDYIRVVAARDNTVTLVEPQVPALAALNGRTFQAGEMIEIATNLDFEIRANGPILVGQYMVGSDHQLVSNHPACSGGIGDPAFLLSVPSSQYRDNYIFLIPEGYEEDYVTVTMPQGTNLTLDGQSISLTDVETIGATGYVRGYYDFSAVTAPDGPVTHTLTGTQPFGLQVYGYDCAVSYAYPGGLNLEP
ncbi:MAG: IgGFc-binding protein, partial [Myxococcales bacterium]|nr:IgGFc-binding protein [Myxococcales bacterium]